MRTTDDLQFWSNQATRHLALVSELTERLALATMDRARLAEKATEAAHALQLAEAKNEMLVARGEKLAGEWVAMSERLASLEMELARAREGIEDPPSQQPEPRQEVAVAGRPQANPLKNAGPKPCKKCGNIFTPDFLNRTYCSDDCAPLGKRRNA